MKMAMNLSGETQTEQIISFENVTKRYGLYEVLSGLSFSVNAGEHLALIGPSGSGKTTILRVLMTLEGIDEGDVLLDGRSLLYEHTCGHRRLAREAYLSERRRNIGMVFQQFNLFPHLTVLQNIALPMTLTRNVSARQAKEVATGLLEMVGVAEKATAMPSNLSGGQKQRVAIARALALEPKVLLLDEITSALDPELVEEVLGVIKLIGSRSPVTMLLVTHEMSFARDFANRVLFLDGGKIVESGTPDEIFSRPQEARTQRFLKKIVAAGYRL